MPDTYTERLNIRKIQPTDYFISDTFNAILDDIDAKVLGIDHLDTALHWTEWKKGTAYERNDVVRWVGMKSHQYAKCLTGGISGTTSPGNNVTGSVLTEGTVTWKVMSLTEATDTTGPIVLWLGGTQYSRGDVALYANALYRSKLDHTASGTFEPDEAKWTEIYSSIRPWSMNKYYYLNDTVIVDNIIYKCNTAHTSKATFDNVEEVPTWTIVGNLARAMEWQPNTYYLAEQLITKNGLLYRAIETHTSDGLDFTNDSLKWEPVFASIIPWTSNAWYDQDVVVSYNNILYRCIEPHTSSANFDYSKWQLLHDPNAFIRDWASNTQYYQNQVVRYNGNLYRCNTTNNDATWNIAKWTLLTDSINDWVASRDYVVGQYVNYNGSLYKCIVANNDSSFTIAKWQKVSGGGLDTWTSNTEYSVGDVVINAGKIYQCNTAHTSSSTFNTDVSNWTEISACITRIPNWEVNKGYVIGDLVSHDAKIYRCITAHTSESTWNQTEEAKWEELSPTINEISTWTPSTDYAVGQLVIHNNKLYRCNTAHTSDSTSFNTDIAYWNEIGSSGGIEPWKANELYTQGNMVVYNDKIYVCDTAHTSTSTFDPTKWHEISSNDIDSWQTSTIYSVGDMVVKDNQLYRCITAHTSDSSDFNNDIANWQTLDTKFLAKDWASNNLYLTDEVVSYDDVLYKANTNHVSSSTIDLDDSKLDFVYANIRPWESNTYYRQGSIVVCNGGIYECLSSHTSGNSITLMDAYNGDGKIIYRRLQDVSIDLTVSEYTFDLGSIKTITNLYFELYSSSARWKTLTFTVSNDNNTFTPLYTWNSASDWSANETWDVPVTGSGRYVRISASNMQEWSRPKVFAITNLKIKTIDVDNWRLLSGYPIWESSVEYIVGNLVTYDSNIYRCNTTHMSGSTFDTTKWDMIGGNGINIWTTNTDYVIDDIVIYNSQFYRCTIAHTSDSSDFDVDIANWLLLDTKWKAENWVASKLYTANEVVLYDNRLFKCVSTHTSAVDFATDANYWQALSAKLEPWKAITYYTIGDTVINNNKLYKCIVAHTSDSTSISADISNWEIVGSGGIDTWKSNEDYTTSSVVIYDNKIYKCNTAHTSSSTFDPTKWGEISSADIDLWQASTAYKTGNLVIKDGQIYRCITAHTSSSTFNSDIANWDILDTKWQAKDWATNTLYMQNEVILYNGAPYRTNTTHISLADFSSDETNFDLMYSNIIEWEPSIYYKQGSIVSYNGGIYKCILAHTSTNSFGLKSVFSGDSGINSMSHPMYPGYSNNTGILNLGSSYNVHEIRATMNMEGSKWCKLDISLSSDNSTYTDVYSFYDTSISSNNSETYSFVISSNLSSQYVKMVASDQIFWGGYGQKTFSINPVEVFVLDNIAWELIGGCPKWRTGIKYTVDKTVIYEDKIYRCITSNSDEYFTKSKWVEVSKNVLYPDWESNVDYFIDDIVIYQNQLYKCITSHTSASDFNSDFDKWISLDKNCFVYDWAINTPYYVDEVVRYDEVLFRCKTQHVSATGEEPINIKLYEASGNVIYVDDTTTIPYIETIDLGSIQKVTDIDYTESTTDMSFTYTIETSEDNIVYNGWTEDPINARYIKLTVDSVNIVSGAASPKAYLDNFTVYGDNNKWERLISGESGDLVYATNSDIDNLFI